MININPKNEFNYTNSLLGQLLIYAARTIRAVYKSECENGEPVNSSPRFSASKIMGDWVECQGLAEIVKREGEVKAYILGDCESSFFPGLFKRSN